MELKGQWCDNVRCPDFRKVDGGNIGVHSQADRRYICRTCRQTFSADQGTFFETIRSDRLAIVETFALLGERNRLRAIERLTQHPHNAVMHWLDLAGPHTSAVSEHLIHHLHMTQAQIDELWTFVKKNRLTSSRMTRPMWATCGFGAPSHCRAACESSVISVMNVVKRKP